jgi:hypothetical protein
MQPNNHESEIINMAKLTILFYKKLIMTSQE